jgi:N-acetylglucosamine-6-phosphate deacetylase
VVTKCASYYPAVTIDLAGGVTGGVTEAVAADLVAFDDFVP